MTTPIPPIPPNNTGPNADKTAEYKVGDPKPDSSELDFVVDVPPEGGTPIDGKQTEDHHPNEDHQLTAGVNSLCPFDSFVISEVTDADNFAGRYKMIREIGRGGMGIVFIALDKGREEKLTPERVVALKLITTQNDVNISPRVIKRFVQEGRTQGRLEHEHILPVYEVGRAGGINYISMRLAEGGSLAKPLIGLTLLQKLLIVVDVLRALQYTHNNGVIHRDVKPGNILLDTEFTSDETVDMNGKIIVWTSSAEQLYGYKADEVLGKHFSILDDDSSNYDEAASLINTMKDKKRVKDHIAVRKTKAGKTILVALNVSQNKDDEGKVVAISASGRIINTTTGFISEPYDRAYDYTRPKAYLADYGLCKDTREVIASVSRSGVIKGSPAYMAPEQARADKATIGPRSDLYSVGMTIYEILAGEVPFRKAGTLLEYFSGMATMQLDGIPEDLQRRLPGLREIVNRLMAFNPNDRYRCADEAADDILKVIFQD